MNGACRHTAAIRYNSSGHPLQLNNQWSNYSGHPLQLNHQWSMSTHNGDPLYLYTLRLPMVSVDSQRRSATTPAVIRLLGVSWLQRAISGDVRFEFRKFLGARAGQASAQQPRNERR